MLGEIWLQLIMPPAQTALISLCITKRSLNRLSSGEYAHRLVDSALNGIHFGPLRIKLVVSLCVFTGRDELFAGGRLRIR